MKICIVAHNAYGMMSGDKSRHIGGVELQTSMMARWLVGRGHDVTLLTWHEGVKRIEEFDGVRVIKTCRRDGGIPGVRFFWPRWSSLVEAMRIADAELYYQNGAEYVTGQVAIWCRRNNRRFIFSVASDVEVQRELPGLPKWRERVLYRYGLRCADRVIAQTTVQVRRLQAELGVTSQKLAMPCIGPSDEAYRRPVAPENDSMTVLFVGRIANVKRVELLLEVARQSPSLRFILVGGGNRDHDYARRIFNIADSLENVTMYGRADRDELNRIYPQASVLCCTSEHEGFPNTFLEAWSHGLPIVSTVDPDNIIRDHLVGQIAHDADGIVAALRHYATVSVEQWGRDSDNARSFFVRNHALDPALRQFEALFLGALDGQ